MPITLDFKPKGLRLKSIFSILPWGFREASDEKEDKIRLFIYRAQEIEEKMAEIRIRLERRSEELFRKVIAALRQGDRKKAEVYAAEVAHLKKFLKFIRAVELLAIRAVERVKTASDARELSETLLAFTAALDEVREQMKGLYPSLAIMYGEIAKNVKMMLLETMPPDATDIDVDVVSREANRMLEEVLREAENEVEKLIPSESLEKILGAKRDIIEKTGVLPASMNKETGSRTAKSETEKRISGGTPSAGSRQAASSIRSSASSARSLAQRNSGVGAKSSATPGRSRISAQELERILLDYILVHGGFLDLSDFTRRYGVTKEEVLAALHRLHAKGLIRLA